MNVPQSVIDDIAAAKAEGRVKEQPAKCPACGESHFPSWRQDCRTCHGTGLVAEHAANVPCGRRGEEGPRTADVGPDTFLLACEAHGIPRPVPEFPFAVLDGRRWRFDYAWPTSKLALEIEGGVWTQGRHVRGKGFLGDLEKYNDAACRGWRLIRFTPQQIDSGECFPVIRKALQLEPP